MGETDKDQKTQEPTEKKLADARSKGDVAIAAETRHAVMFLAMLLVLGGLGAATLRRLGSLTAGIWGNADDLRLDPDGAQHFASALLGRLATVLGPLLGALFVFALLILFVQGRPTLAWHRIAPNFSKLSPAAGLKRLFGPRALVEFAKMLAKFALVAGVAGFVLWPTRGAIDRLVGIAPGAIGAVASSFVAQMLKAVALLAGALALADFAWQRRAFLARMRMSLQEVKDEHKEAEGDPRIKQRVRTIAMQRARSRMMAAVPKASVVVTNPTHYAVALKYDHGQMAAPVVVAKGADAIALKIREVAAEAKVPVVESPPLARALYASAVLDRPIPTEHYAAVAEIIGYVMRLAKRKR